MKNFILGIVFSILVFSCGTQAKKMWNPGNVEQLTLLVGQDKPELFYPYCGKRKWFSKKCKKRGRLSFDLNKKENRRKFKYFICKHESRKW